MSLFRRALWVLVCGGLLGLVGVVPGAGSATAASKKAACSPTVYVPNESGPAVSTIDAKTMTKNPTDIPIGASGVGFSVVFTPDGKTALVGLLTDQVVAIDVKTGTKKPTVLSGLNFPGLGPVTRDGKTAFFLGFPGNSAAVSSFNVKTMTKNPTDVDIGETLAQAMNYGGNPTMALTPDGKTLFVARIDTVKSINVKTMTLNPDITGFTNAQAVTITPDGKTLFVDDGNSISSINVKTMTKNPTSIPGFSNPGSMAITPDGKTLFVIGGNFGDHVSSINVKTMTKNPTDIPVGTSSLNLAITPDSKTVFVMQHFGAPAILSSIDVKTMTKNPTDIPVANALGGIAITPCRSTKSK